MPSLPWQSRAPCWRALNWDQDRLPREGPAPQHHVEVPGVELPHERGPASCSARIPRLFLVIPGRVNCSRLSELLSLLWFCCRTALIVWINTGPEMWETVNHEPGTGVREHLKSILLLASRWRNSTRSASLPTASVEARSETPSSHLDRAQSADMTVPPGPTQEVGPPHLNEKTLTFQAENAAITTESLGRPRFALRRKNSSANCYWTERSVSAR